MLKRKGPKERSLGLLCAEGFNVRLYAIVVIGRALLSDPATWPADRHPGADGETP